jgi:ATP-dependent RNA helicase DDX27
VDCGTPHVVAVIRSRTVPSAVVSHYAAKIVSLEDRIKEVLVAEKIARLDRLAEMEVVRAENIIKHSEEIKSRPPREWLSSGTMKENEQDDAQKKQQQQGLKSSTNAGNHRMTRKKRRAREAREALLSLKAQHKEGMTADVENNNTITETSIKVLAKAQKKSKKEEEERTNKRSIYDDDVNREEKSRIRKKSKGILGRDASGDGGLFDEEKITFAKKHEEKAVPSAYSFRGYDPNKKFGKGGKKGHNTFKSKKRFKRRK